MQTYHKKDLKPRENKRKLYVEKSNLRLRKNIIREDEYADKTSGNESMATAINTANDSKEPIKVNPQQFVGTNTNTTPLTTTIKAQNGIDAQKQFTNLYQTNSNFKRSVDTGQASVEVLTPQTRTSEITNSIHMHEQLVKNSVPFTKAELNKMLLGKK